MNHIYSSSRSRGFTLIELVIVLVIAGIVGGYAIPSWRTYVQNGRIVTYTNELVADINLARSEAILRGARVVICKSANPEAAAPTCTAAGAWTTGRIIFVDAAPTLNGTYAAADNDLLLRRRGPLESADGTLTAVQDPSGVAVNAIAFDKIGMALIDPAQQASFRVCDERSFARGRSVSVSATGRAMIGRPTAC